MKNGYTSSKFCSLNLNYNNLGHKTTYGQIRVTNQSEILFPTSLVQTRGLLGQIQTF